MSRGHLSKSLSLVVVLLSLPLSGCSRAEFALGSFLEGTRRYLPAVRAFIRFADRHPADPRAAEALVRAGRIYSDVLLRCAEARPLFERAAREHQGAEPWVTRARIALLDCPGYFPLKDGTLWTFVDSDTGGKNMKLEVAVRASTDGVRGRAEGAYYAGKKKIRDYRRAYLKQDWAVWETEGQDKVCILRYPFEPGMAWTGRREGKPVEFRIESDMEAVSVKAGDYRGCLKVRETAPGAEAWKYEYYCPGAGRVKTTIGGPGFENPNTELGSQAQVVR